MLVSDKEALGRLGSPDNLMNRLRAGNSNGRKGAMNLFGIGVKKDEHINNTPILKQVEELKPAVFQSPFSSKEETSLTISPSIPTFNPPETADQPNTDDLVSNADNQIKLAHAHDKSLETLTLAVDMLKLKLDDIKPDKLPSVISATSKVVDQIQRQRIDASKSRQDRQVHFHFYTPTQKKMEDYQVIEVG